ncbi:MAG: serine--tRNA ligase, partial [Nitrospina sp.]|nr:serine--tRNA ligase [Nitrospina sp.]MBT7935368.1 serine--tRNA ligase [Nitrospina sp.]
MLDLKTIRENPEAVKTRLKRRGGDFKELDELLKPEEDRRSGLQESELLKNKKKKLSAEVGQLKQKGQDASNLMEEVKTINISIKELDDKIQAWEQQVQEKLLGIPNTPDDSIPDGADESANRMVRDWGTKPEFAFKPKNHVEVGEQLGLIDLKRAAKISGARFAVYKGQGAGLLRALINFMIDVQTRENGYQELYPPFLVNKESMLGTGQLPKFEEELFATRDDPLYLIPTAEVPVTNFHRDEILEEESLPICYAAYTPCFRREAGSYGKDTQGLIRQHQFDKVELVKFSRAEESSAELEKLVENAES